MHLKLFYSIHQVLAGKKVMAAMVMKTGADDRGTVVSLGTGRQA